MRAGLTRSQHHNAGQIVRRRRRQQPDPHGGVVVRVARLAQEPIDGNPYRNFIAVKQGSENEAWVKTLVAAYQNDTVKAEFDKVYKGTGLSAY